uniref:Uncharacterized protein n=1 Tax=Anopheles dirus TaxID=7168 RepID=A0A182NB39_9DIPT
MRPKLDVWDVSRDFFHLKACAKVRGLVVLKYNCRAFTDIQRFTLYSEKYRGDTYHQLHIHRRLYKVYRRFGPVQVLDTDGDTYVVFYGCQQVQHRALIGLMVLVRADVYDRFTPPPGLVQLLWLKLSFNVTQHVAHSLDDQEKHCDCLAASKHINRKVFEGYQKEQAQLKARERIKQQFPIGIRNFFVCVFSFALALLCANKLIDKFVFDLEY